MLKFLKKSQSNCVTLVRVRRKRMLKVRDRNHGDKRSARAENRTRGPTMATLDFTTKPLALALLTDILGLLSTEKIKNCMHKQIKICCKQKLTLSHKLWNKTFTTHHSIQNISCSIPTTGQFRKICPNHQ